MICQQILLLRFLNEPELIFLHLINRFKHFYLLLIICLHTVKWFQALQYNSRN